MAIFNTDLDYTQLIQFTNGTLQLGSFVQIRNALVKRMKELYGNDIDVSPASADGQYVNSLALIFNNIMQTIKKGNDSLDPAVATGQYLDTLCSFNNISRIEPTASVAELYIYNSTGAPVKAKQLTFIDKNNILWKWYGGGEEIEIPVPSESEPAYLLTDVVCEELGDISAEGAGFFCYYEDGQLRRSDDPRDQEWSDPSLYVDSDINGTIFQCIDQNGLYVWQYKDAQIGEVHETDEALRSRRYQMLGNNSVTVLEGLKGNLLAISAIDDAYIFNNTASGDDVISLSGDRFKPIADGCALKGNSIYIALRYKPGVEINDDSVGKMIYSKLTPGIATSPFKSTSAKSYTLLHEKPADWDDAYGRYCSMTQNADTTWAKDTFYSKDGARYELTEEEPADWSEHYADYYKASLNNSASFAADSFAAPDDSKMMEIQRTDEFSDFIYWKSCSPIHPKITIRFNTNTKIYDYPANYASSNASRSPIEDAIISSLRSALSQAKINDWLSISTLLTAMQQADRQKNGMPTFLVERGYFGEAQTDCLFPADLNYFEYSEDMFSFEYDLQGGLPTGGATLTIG